LLNQFYWQRDVKSTATGSTFQIRK